MPDKAIAILSKARKQLAEAKTLMEVKAVRDVGHASLKWAKQQRDIGFEAQVDAAEITLRAERRLGEMLAEMEKSDGGRPTKTGNITLPVFTLSDHGITKMQSSRWQAEATVEESDFEKWIAEHREAAKIPTQSALIKHGRRKKKRRRSPAKPMEGIYADLVSLSSEGKQFGTIYADPPWAYSNKATRASADGEYANTMTVEEICNEIVPELCLPDCHLHLWTTNGFLFEAKRVMDAWGFEYRSCFVWVKPQMGIGNYWRVSHEFLLLGIRGNAKSFARHDYKSWAEFDRTEHSRKPRRIREIIETVSPGPYLEMYGRQQAPGWTVYGNQVSEQTQFV